jgi:hypothetical protein
MLQQGQSRVANDIPKCFDYAKHYATSKVAAKGSKTTSKSRQNSNITQYMGIIAHQHLKNFSRSNIEGGCVRGCGGSNLPS